MSPGKICGSKKDIFELSELKFLHAEKHIPQKVYQQAYEGQGNLLALEVFAWKGRNRSNKPIHKYDREKV